MNAGGREFSWSPVFHAPTANPVDLGDDQADFTGKKKTPSILRLLVAKCGIAAAAPGLPE